jgi:hypothetical protein
MYRRDRPIDPDFQPTEFLYVRCRAEDIEGEHLSPLSVKFPDWSVNREKCGQPQDVLISRWPTWGIAAFQVRDVPPSLTSVGNVTYNFRVEHVPDEDNYAHSEIRTYRGPIHHQDLNSPPKLVKKDFRYALSQKTSIVRQCQS